MNIKVIDGAASGSVVFDIIAPSGDKMYGNRNRKLPKGKDYLIQVSTIKSGNTNFKLQISIR